MKAVAVDIFRPATLAEALERLTEDGARILAGGQSLVPALNLRLEAPSVLVDINGIAGFCGLEERGAEIAIGPLVRHAEVLRSPVVKAHLPLMEQAMHHVAHPAIRNRGTTLGSLANADPAAEMPAVAVVLDAVLVLASLRGRREVAARDFFLGLYETARDEDEMIVEVRYPKALPGQCFGFGEVAQRLGDFASVAIAARATMDGERIAVLEVVAFACEPAPLLLTSLDELARGQVWTAELVEALAECLASEIDPMENLAGGSATKRAQARALARRVLSEMAER